MRTAKQIHKGYSITRIRAFYTRKVKFTQQNYHDRITRILEEFPRLDDIHPFYGDLINVLYDKDHYKLALAQLNTARHLIDALCKDYIKLLKYGDSLYRCKQLKRAALGRMCTLIKKQAPSLEYLEQVRQHLGRLPSIDPTTRTLLVCGYPNVGKSSFINKVTRADSEVQPYAFTTKSLVVGHMDYQYLRWQVIDTPGILDHPLEDRNIIEMQSITALAHLRAAVLYFIDISTQCGYSIEQQISLFESIKPLFANKPLIIVLTKVDLVRPDELTPEHRAKLAELESEENTQMFIMSTVTEEGMSDVKEKSCDALLASRVQQKMKGKKINDILNRIHVAMPKKRDEVERPIVIPDAVIAAIRNRADNEEMQIARRLERHLEEENGGPGMHDHDWRKGYMLENDEWKYDTMPEIMDGKNIADFLDPEIEAMLDRLEAEEEERAADDAKLAELLALDSLTPEQASMLAKIREKRAVAQMEHRSKKGKNRAVLTRTVRSGRFDEDRFAEVMKSRGLDPTSAIQRTRSASRGRNEARKRTRDERSQSGVRGHDANSRSIAEHRSASRGPAARSQSRPPQEGEGYRNVKQKLEAVKMADKSAKRRNREARKGPGDRTVPDLKPKHLFSGKTSGGTRDRR